MSKLNSHYHGGPTWTIKILTFLIISLAFIYGLSQYLGGSLQTDPIVLIQNDHYASFSINATENLLYVLEAECACRQNEQILITSQKTLNDSIIRIKRHWKDSNRTETSVEMMESRFAQLRFLCNFFSLFRRGASQRVVGYSLYGKNPFYYNKLINISSQLDERMPGWSMRVHHDESINRSIICQIECMKRETSGEYIDNADFCNVNQMHLTWNDFREKRYSNFNYTHAMSWRWFPIGCSSVHVFSSRDTDSFILQRELDSVDAWLQSNKSGHIMRDHPYHGTEILGGMWGYKSVKDRRTANLIFERIIDRKLATNYNRNGKSPKGADQSFLSGHVFNLIRDDSVIHDSYLCQRYKNSSPWPSKRLGDCFVGSPSGCNETAVFKDCPQQCRPKDHSDWTQC